MSTTDVRTPIVFVGMMATGKTTTAQRVGELLGRDSIDIDDVMSEKLGHHCSELLRTDAQAFRDLEVECIRELLALPTKRNIVVSLGGGAVLRKETRDRLKNMNVIWLTGDTSMLLERLRHQRVDRPALQDDAAITLPKLQHEREPYYQDVATVRIDVNHKSLEEVANEVVEFVLERESEQQ